MKTLMLICVTFAMTNAVPVMNTDKFSHITEIERLGRVEEVVEEDNLIEDLMVEAKNCSDFKGYACVRVCHTTSAPIIADSSQTVTAS